MSKDHLILCTTLAAAVLWAGRVLAQTSESPAPEIAGEHRIPRLDLGLSTGWNNPGGIWGGEADFRVLGKLSIGIEGGQGAWGLRITPQVLLTPVVNLCIGYRFQLGRWGWIAARAGGGGRLRDDNYKVRGEALYGFYFGELYQPGGLIAGLAGGISIY